MPRSLRGQALPRSRCSVDAGGETVTAIPPKPLPPRRTFIGLGVLVVGGFLAFSAWSSGRTVDAVALGGEQITADILQATETKGGHAIRIGWSDGTGVHHYGPIPIGEAFWNKITQNGQLTVHQTAIRYRGDDPAARPLIVDDAPEAALVGAGRDGVGVSADHVRSGTCSLPVFARRRNRATKSIASNSHLPYADANHSQNLWGYPCLVAYL